MLIITAGQDPLRDDGAQYAERLRALGAVVDDCAFPGQILELRSARRAIPKDRTALSHVAGWLRRRFTAPPAVRARAP